MFPDLLSGSTWLTFGSAKNGVRATMSKTITLDEIKAHNSSETCWIAVDGIVYDITDFLDQHPGGEEVVLETAGTDATGSFDDVGHSSDARDQLKKYKIGELPAEEKAMLKAQQEEQKKSGGGGGGSGVIGVVAVIAAAVGAYFYMESQKKLAE
mmetsp:Transcript_3649/g.11432  ORF Transcript_3649/g.11432 Transcript_3649/m.11432 type:complete len:154 (+) Transcript_3649:2-463(+)